MSEHTKEPWTTQGLQTWSDDHLRCYIGPGHGGHTICHVFHEGPGKGTCDANAARIVACVNACAGLDPEAIPETVEAVGDLIKAYQLSEGIARELHRVELALAKVTAT